MWVCLLPIKGLQRVYNTGERCFLFNDKVLNLGHLYRLEYSCGQLTIWQRNIADKWRRVVNLSFKLIFGYNLVSEWLWKWIMSVIDCVGTIFIIIEWTQWLWNELFLFWLLVLITGTIGTFTTANVDDWVIQRDWLDLMTVEHDRLKIILFLVALKIIRLHRF